SWRMAAPSATTMASAATMLHGLRMKRANWACACWDLSPAISIRNANSIPASSCLMTELAENARARTGKHSSRAELWAGLNEHSWDVIVVGGGITGAGVARE